VYAEVLKSWLYGDDIVFTGQKVKSFGLCMVSFGARVMRLWSMLTCCIYTNPLSLESGRATRSKQWMTLASRE